MGSTIPHPTNTDPTDAEPLCAGRVGDESAATFFCLAKAMWNQVNQPGALWVDQLVQVRARMRHPRPGDVVVDLATLVSGFDPSRVGVLDSVRRGTAVIRPWGRDDERITFQDVRFVALPGHGDDWPS